MAQRIYNPQATNSDYASASNCPPLSIPVGLEIEPDALAHFQAIVAAGGIDEKTLPGRRPLRAD